MHEGAYSDWEVDVTDLLRPPGEDNELVLGISMPWRVDERAHVLEPATYVGKMSKHTEYMRGMLQLWWDVPLNGHAVLPFGPWRDIHLDVRSGPTLLRLAAGTLAIGDDVATVRVDLEWWNDAPDGTDVDLTIELSPDTFEGPTERFAVTATIPPGRSDASTTIEVVDPRLWWTWDTGPQNLYRLSANGVETLLGIRNVERDPATLQFRINGKRLFMRGTWLTPASIFSSQPRTVQLARDVEMLRESNMNHAVIFGHVQRDEYYQEFDRLGILIFQQLPFLQFGPMSLVNPDHPRHRAYWDWSLSEVDRIVRRLAGHPSLAVWAAFAETRKNGQWVFANYTDYSDRISEIVHQRDPDATYHASFCDFGEQHIWNGGHAYGEFVDHYDANEKFISEYGSQAPPVVATMRELVPEKSLWNVPVKEGSRCPLPIDVEDWSYIWGYEYPGLMTNISRAMHHVDRKLPTLERTIDAMQWYQWFGNRYCTEAYRRKRFDAVAGVRTWAFRDAQAGPKACNIDHHQRPRMGYYALQESLAPLSLQIDDRFPLEPLAIDTTWTRDVLLINDFQVSREVVVRHRLVDTTGAAVADHTTTVHVAADAAARWPLTLLLPSTPGPYLVRLEASDPDGTLVASRDQWLTVVPPAFEGPPVRVLVLGQSLYNAPVVSALRPVGGIELTVVDETNRRPQSSGWSEDLDERVDVVWFTGWDYAAHQFTNGEWTNIVGAVDRGVGFVHTGGQASFHGSDGRGALLDCTPLAAVLPVVLRPHDAVIDRWPGIVADRAADVLGIELDGYPAYGCFSRVTARPGSETLATIGEYPLLVTGTYGAGRTLAFSAGLTRWHSVFKYSQEQQEFGEDVDQVIGPWERSDVRDYDLHWRGNLGLFLGLLQSTTGRALAASPGELAEAYQRPIFETLAEIDATELEVAVDELDWLEAAAETRGAVVVRNRGSVVARLVRGEVVTAATLDHRFRDGFVDLLPGQEVRLRFEAACRPEDIDTLDISAHNARRRVGVGATTPADASRGEWR